MDNNTLAILKADLKAQMDLIKTIAARLIERATNLQSDDIVRLESIAYQIHNLYNATEDLLKVIAANFENNITDQSQWHSILLQRMTQNITEIRPALLSHETYLLLNSLRGFRHFFRHAYGATIEYAQLKINLDKALNLLPCLEDDVNNFVSRLANDEKKT
jgi:hypothetical protein